MKSLGIVVTAVILWTNAYGASNVGLVNELKGDVTYGANRAKAQAFMKVQEGDRFVVGPNSQVRVLYIASGRQETYIGPARFVVGASSGKVEQGAAPQIAEVAAGVAQRVGRSMALLENVQMSRVGGVTLRGIQRLTPEQEANLAEARKTYEAMRSSAAADDITPELYLYSVAEEYRMTGEMKTLIAEMRRRQPDNAEIAKLANALERPAERR